MRVREKEREKKFSERISETKKSREWSVEVAHFTIEKCVGSV